MSNYVRINQDGRFELQGKRWMCNSVVYYGRYPGTCNGNWFRDDHWEKNKLDLDRDFAGMAEIGLNHTAMFFNNDGFFDNGKVMQSGFDRLDCVVEAAKRNAMRLSIFIVPFIDSPEVFKQITGRQWEYDERWLPSFNPALHDAYVQQIAPFARRYQNEPTVIAYTDRIDRFYKGFDNVSIPFNLKDEWISWLQTRYGSFANLMDAVGGAAALENHPEDWGQILLPQESKWNASMRNPLAYDYILMQKTVIGEAQAEFDRKINELAPNQFVWTPFEGNTNTWAMLDGFSPETKKLQAIWMEYYFFEMTRPSFVQPFEEWVHTREVVHRRMGHELPVVYNAAYAMARYLKKSVQQPVVICHGGTIGWPAYGCDTPNQQAALIDRVNAACLNADADGWHYWNWTDDHASGESYTEERDANPDLYYFAGESTGLHKLNGSPRPATVVASRYSRELARRAAANKPARESKVLVLNSSPRMYSLFRRLALPTASAVIGALTRLGIQPDYRWSSQNDILISDEVLHEYKFIVIADNMYGRDYAEMPEKLLNFVEDGGTLYLAMDQYRYFEDEHGVQHQNAAMQKLLGVDENGYTDWPGATTPCANWPFPTDASQEPNMDVQAFPRLNWGIIDARYRRMVPEAQKVSLLGFRSTDDDIFTPVPGLVAGSEVIAVGKFAPGSRPFIYKHRIGKGKVYVNCWTNNIFRDNELRADFGGWEFDWVLDIPLMESGIQEGDLTAGASMWLRHQWGYFWQDK